MSARGSTLTDLATGPGPCGHQVTFYESDDYLAQSTAAFLATPLAAGRPAIAVAAGEHLDAIRSALAVRAAHPAGGPHPGRLVLLDAHETLDRLMADGVPDPAAFEAVIGELVDRLAHAGGEPRIFGEMVAVLWDEGNLTGALALEDLWNELGQSRAFLLSCAYPIRSFDADADADAFREVCRRHSSVAPGESYSHLRDPDARLRRVAELQRETAAGTSERQALQRKQDELEATLERLRELDRLRSEFVAMVAHDIRGPATLVSASLELLQDAVGHDDETTSLLGNATEGARSIQRLAGDILTMSRLEAGEFDFELRPLDPADVVARAVREVRATTGRSIEVEQPARRPRVLADADRQIQILTNLLSNAVKFSPEGSPVRVHIERIEEGDRHVVISVSNQGPGIAEEDQAKLFRPFSRLAEQRRGAGGTGLGLVIAKALVEGQGGTIHLDSRPGRGTTLSYTVLVAPGG